MLVDPKNTQLAATHEDRSLYFCSLGCKATFDKDPHGYGHPK